MTGISLICAADIELQPDPHQYRYMRALLTNAASAMARGEIDRAEWRVSLVNQLLGKLAAIAKAEVGAVMNHRLYLAGPMTGLPDFNYPAFHEAAARLRAAGFEVVNPAEDGLPVEAPWTQHLKLAITKLMTCDAVATLPGWRDSDGARLEAHNAAWLDMPVRSVEGWLISKSAPTAHTPIHTAPAA